MTKKNNDEIYVLQGKYNENISNSLRKSQGEVKFYSSIGREKKY